MIMKSPMPSSPTRLSSRLCPVAGVVVAPVKEGDVHEILGLDPLNTADVDPIFIWVRSPVMMGVDAAMFAKVMFGAVRVKGIGAQIGVPFDDLEILEVHGCCNRSFARADRAIASP